MAEIILLLIFCIPAILGMAEILHIVKVWLISPSCADNRIIVEVPRDENFHQQIIKTAEQVRWNGKAYANRVIVLVTFLDDQNKKKCADLANKFGFKISEKYDLTDKIFEG